MFKKNDIVGAFVGFVSFLRTFSSFSDDDDRCCLFKLPVLATSAKDSNKFTPFGVWVSTAADKSNKCYMILKTIS